MLRAEKYVTGRFGDCLCPCHRFEGMVHCAPCCGPEDGEYHPADDEQAVEKSNIGHVEEMKDYVCARCGNCWTVSEPHPDAMTLLCPCPNCDKLTWPEHSYVDRGQTGCDYCGRPIQDHKSMIVTQEMTRQEAEKKFHGLLDKSEKVR